MSERRPRWRASRAGIINVFEYGSQVFEFGDGRLLLRGPNGSGKSKAMELLFPFLFEGDMQPTKLDPFGKKARKMKWNLLMDGRYATRIGYAWFELRHDDPRHTPQYVTFGVCLHAHKEWDDVKPRFFYVAGMRVGLDFELDPDGRPLSRQQLHELITSLGGETFAQANHYQERLNQVAFSYPTLKRLGQQIRLQRTLRRPQLSDTLDEQLLNELLSDALPEIDCDLLERSSRRLEQIEESRVRLDTLKRNAQAVRDFAITYGNYARAELRERRDALREAAAAAERALAEHDRCEADLAAVQVRLDQTVAALEQAEAELTRLRAAERTLLASPEMQAADELAHARERAAAAGEQLARTTEQQTEAAGELARAGERRDSEEQRLREAFNRFQTELIRLGELADAAGVAAHGQLAAGLEGDAAIGPIVEQLERAVRERRQAIEETRRYRLVAEDRARLAHKQASAREQARERAHDARSARVTAEKELAAGRGALGDRVAAWAGGTRELQVDDALHERLERALEGVGAPEAERLADVVAPAFAAAEGLLGRLELALERRDEQLAEARRPLEDERAALEAEVDPEPTPLPTRGAREPGRPGAPFWRLVDFADGLDDAERAGLEGALEGAGLLDGWVTPQGSVLAAGSDDVALVPAEIGNAPTLADHLRSAAGELPVAREIVERILRSIGVGRGREQGCVVLLDGSFAFGPARGAHPKARPQFIGAAARAENRARRLAELADTLTELEAAGRALAGERSELEARRGHLAADRQHLPSEQPAREAYAALVRARQEEEAARRGFDAAELAAIEAEREADLARDDVALVAGRHELDPRGDEQSLRRATDRLDGYADGLGGLRDAGFERRSALTMIEKLAADVAAADRRLADRAADVERAEGELHAAEGRLSGLDALSAGAERALRRRDELMREVASCEREGKRLTEERLQRSNTVTKLAGERERAAEKVGEAESARAGALAELRAYMRAELLPLAIGEHSLARDREQALAWEADEWLHFFDALEHDVLATRAHRETLQNQLDRDYELLRQQVDASQLQISRERVDGLLLVRGYVHGAEQPLATLIESLAEEVEESERRLSEEDRRLFEEFVTGGLAEHLHLRINEAKETVERMNEEMSKVQASSGMSIEIRWQRDDAGGSTLRRALELLQSAPARLSVSEQAELQEFVREQVRLARLEAEQDETTLAQLAKALDYRRWHVFKLRKANAARGIEARELTRHEHDTGSGGEKAISLHLPLLAAAASYPASGKPDALRMVMLDEAFTRIDEEGRRGIMALIAKFDLDLMLTSPDFWGCYAEVPELSIYALAPRDPSVPGVVSRHFHWDGEKRSAA